MFHTDTVVPMVSAAVSAGVPFRNRMGVLAENRILAPPLQLPGPVPVTSICGTLSVRTPVGVCTPSSMGARDVITPLIDLSKADIVRRGVALGAPLELTWSCYRGDARPCGDCDACVLRAKGFGEAGVADPALS